VFYIVDQRHGNDGVLGCGRRSRRCCCCSAPTALLIIAGCNDRRGFLARTKPQLFEAAQRSSVHSHALTDAASDICRWWRRRRCGAEEGIGCLHGRLILIIRVTRLHTQGGRHDRSQILMHRKLPTVSHTCSSCTSYHSQHSYRLRLFIRGHDDLSTTAAAAALELSRKTSMRACRRVK